MNLRLVSKQLGIIAILIGATMLFNFAHGDIFMVGAYIGFGVATGILALLSLGALALPNWAVLVLTILFSMLLTAVLGMLVERVGYRPLRSAPRASAAITRSIRSPSILPGQIALTVIPYCPVSIASDLVKPIIAHLAAA